MDTLWIEGSPKGDDALSCQLAKAFLEGTRYQRLSAWDEDLLRFGRDAAVAKFAPLFGDTVTDRQQDIWQQVLDEVERVRAFDRLVISSPKGSMSVPLATGSPPSSS